ncbi:uncharacterized protein LOC102781844, partial [Neolamprologus brichardi]|uniref:uncharacterized protein LOC102781844 n=1 Tax=Neolamprologus brichardi TaxID=32507 RepID=UPI001643B837
ALLPPQTSFNVSITRSGCSTDLSTVLQAEGAQKGSLNLSLTCEPQLSLRASVLHSIEPIKKLQFPTHGELFLNVSTALLPGVEVGLEVGRCFFRGNVGKVKASQTETEQASYTVNVSSFCPLQVSHAVSVAKTSDTVRVNSHFRHTVNCLKKLGVSVDNSIQVEFGSAEGKGMSLQSQFGGQLAGLRLKMKNVPMTKEIRGTMWHSWSWLHDRGLPSNIEGLCSIQGTFSQLQSRAQLTVEGHKLLTSGLNFSGTNGHLSVLLSYSPPAFNQTRTQCNLDAVLTAQFKGQTKSRV